MGGYKGLVRGPPRRVCKKGWYNRIYKKGHNMHSSHSVANIHQDKMAGNDGQEGVTLVKVCIRMRRIQIMSHLYNILYPPS